MNTTNHTTKTNPASPLPAYFLQDRFIISPEEGKNKGKRPGPIRDRRTELTEIDKESTRW